MFQVLVGEAIDLEIRPADRELRVMFDPAQLEQVMINLVVNARDALPEGGSIVLGFERIRLEGSLGAADGEVPPGEYALLSVEDDGAGIDPDDLDRIFEPFFTTKPQGEGTGLGLSTVYGIVSQNGGHVRAESEPGRGTRIEIYLPLAADRETTPAVASATEEVSSGGSETILLVEDDAIVRELVVAVLDSHGYTILQAGDGVEALAVLDREPQPPDLVITDVVLPKMDGRQLAERLWERFSEIPILFISGYGERTISQHGILEEGIELLQKPFGPLELVGRVRKLLAGASESPESASD